MAANRTARQRAALRKAQIASARKRRGHRRLAYAAGGLTVVAATIGAGYAGHRYAKHTLSGGPRHVLDTVPRGKQLVHLPRRARTMLAPAHVGKATDMGIRAFDRRAKLNARKVARKKQRALYDSRRRQARMRTKPVAKGFPAISTSGSRRSAARRRKRG